MMNTMGLKTGVISFWLLFVLCISAYCQESYSTLNKMAINWSKPFLDCDNGVKTKTVDFQTYHYSISAVFKKKKVAEGHKIEIVDTENNHRLILKGVASYDNDFLLITGIKYDYYEDRFASTYGTFWVSNTDEGLMVYKPKKAGNIRMIGREVLYHYTYYDHCPVIVCLRGTPCIAVDGKMGGKNYLDYSASISPATIEDIGYDKPFELLMGSNKEVRIEWTNGVVFSGTVLLESNEKDGFSFYPLIGNKVGFSNGYKTIRVYESLGSIFMELTDSPENPIMKREVLRIYNKGIISKNNYWNENEFFEKADMVQCWFRNGDVFNGIADVTPIYSQGELISTDIGFRHGTIQYVNGDRFVGQFDENGSKEGVYYYANGDRFEGNVKNKWGNLYFNGTTYLKDGTTMKGDYLRIRSFSELQQKRLKLCKYPSEARSMATVLKVSKKYAVYDLERNSVAITKYFDAYREYSVWAGYGGYLVYRKDRKCYYFMYDSRKINMIVYTDNQGRHIKEVVYDNGAPDYITQYTYYSNHKASSIKTTWFNGERILKCNFFSDGKIRSAYEYRKGNGGEMVLRYSKEAHPTYGGYTSKLYDLNGKYERSINWDIGGNWIYNIDVAPKITMNKKELESMDSRYRDIIQLVEKLDL